MSTQAIEDVLREHRLLWDDDLAEWVCGKTGAVCGWHRRVPREWADESANTHAAHLADAIRAHLAEHTDEAAGAVERVQALADEWDEARRPGMVGISTAIRAALAGGASGAAEEADQ